MDAAFAPFLQAAHAGDLDTDKVLLKEQPQMVTQRCFKAYPTRLEFVAVEGGLGKIPSCVEFAAATIEAGAPLTPETQKRGRFWQRRSSSGQDP